MEQPEKVYLRGQVYDTYTGTGWKAADTEETAQYEDLFYWLHEAGFYGQSQIALADGYTETATPLSMTIRNLSACSAHGTTPTPSTAAKRWQRTASGTRICPGREPVLSERQRPGLVSDPAEPLHSPGPGKTSRPICPRSRPMPTISRAVDLQMTQDSWAVLQRQLKLDTQTRPSATSAPSSF